MTGAPPHFGFALREAPPILLQDGELARTDANSPVHSYGGRLYAFMSHYSPIGHTYRRLGKSLMHLTGEMQRIQLLNDPDPKVGKWIESVWRSPSGRLYGWYHAEELAPCERAIFIPHIAALASDDDGASWHCLGEILRAPAELADCGYNNGFLAGGYGDFSVIADPDADYLYIHYSSYVTDEMAQGVAVARYKIADCDRPGATLELWREGRWWAAAGRSLASPIHSVARGWRHRDPDAFWGPAVHYNRAIDAYVMLLNRTRNGNSNIVQDGVYVSFNQRLDDPSGWSSPVCVVNGGVWYPEVVGTGAHDGDTQAGAPARFFMSGFSAWEISFAWAETPAPPSPPITVDLDDWVRLFGPETPKRLGIG